MVIISSKENIFRIITYKIRIFKGKYFIIIFKCKRRKDFKMLNPESMRRLSRAGGEGLESLEKMPCLAASTPLHVVLYYCHSLHVGHSALETAAA